MENKVSKTNKKLIKQVIRINGHVWVWRKNECFDSTIENGHQQKTAEKTFKESA